MAKKLPLIIDVDGTLIKSDLLLESALGLLKKNMLYMFLMLLWLLKGKAYLKAQIAHRVDIDVSLLPYNQDVLNLMGDASKNGRKVMLASASHYKYINKISEYLKLESDPLASREDLNLSGSKKAGALVNMFGEGGFSYAGNDCVDKKVWARGAQNFVVSSNSFLVKDVQKSDPDIQVISSPVNHVKGLIKASRIHQWSKNFLIFVPMLTAHHWSSVITWQQSIIAFFCFSICASSVYLLNDLLDLEADRQHRSKCKRPFASGSCSLFVGIAAVPVYLVFAFIGACLFLPKAFIAILCGYFVLTTAYSFGLKKMTLVDVFTLAGLYTVRLIAGGAATGIALSSWLVSFSIFIFLSLALIKRYAELYMVKESGKEKARGYMVSDMPLLLVLGVASGMLSVLVFSLYANSDYVSQFYSHKENLTYINPILLFYVSYMWLVTYRGEMHDDPIVYAIKSKFTYVAGLAVVLIAWSAL